MQLAVVLGNKWPAEYNREEYIPDDSSTMERLRTEKLAFPHSYYSLCFYKYWGAGGGFWKRSLLEATSISFSEMQIPTIYFYQKPRYRAWHLTSQMGF